MRSKKKNMRRSVRRRLHLQGMIADTRINVINPQTLSADAQALLIKAKCKTITSNSRCPCGSGKRFKNCHGKEAKTSRKPHVKTNY